MKSPYRQEMCQLHEPLHDKNVSIYMTSQPRQEMCQLHEPLHDKHVSLYMTSPPRQEMCQLHEPLHDKHVSIYMTSQCRSGERHYISDQFQLFRHKMHFDLLFAYRKIYPARSKTNSYSWSFVAG